MARSSSPRAAGWRTACCARAEVRDEVDLLSSRLARLAHDEERFGITPDTRAEGNRLTYSLLRVLGRIG